MPTNDTIVEHGPNSHFDFTGPGTAKDILADNALWRDLIDRAHNMDSRIVRNPRTLSSLAAALNSAVALVGAEWEGRWFSLARYSDLASTR